MGIPSGLRRPVWLVRDLVVDRNNPDLGRLASLDDPDRFVWAILPHAARTFSACIALLPQPVARAAAVAYLYCRMLDTYEDLVPDPGERERALSGFAERLAGATPEPAAAIRESTACDHRDAAHMLLVERHALVDRVYRTLAPDEQALIRTLVREMAAGMRWSCAAFERQGGALRDTEQLARYCRNVIGQPVLFTSRLLRWHQTGDADLPDHVERDAMTVGEMIQLANITRDIEKDLSRGIRFDPRLPEEGQGRAECIRSVRADMLAMALRRAPAYRRLIDYLSPHRFSYARAAGVLMLLFTDRYFNSCASRAGLPTWRRRRSGLRLILAALPAAVSRRWAARVMTDVERKFLRAAAPG